MTKERERIIYIDILNIISCVSVIWLHCNSLLYNYSRDSHWYLSLFVQVAAHFAVPCFLMISGANLMNYREKYSTSEFAVKRFTRGVIPFLIWSALALVYYNFRGDISFSDFKDVAFLFLHHRIDNVYWFFFPLIGVYLCIPVLSLIAKRKYLNYFLYMALGGIFFYSVLPYVMEYFVDLSYSEHIIFPLAAGYLPYALLGYYIANKKFSLPASCVVYAIGIACALYMYYGTISISEIKGSFNGDLIDYQSFVSYGFAAAVFLLFKNIGFRFLDHPKLLRVISTVSGASLGVYLIHMIVMNSFLDITGINSYTYGWQMLGQFPVYIIALIIVLLFKKIPYLGNIIFP